MSEDRVITCHPARSWEAVGWRLARSLPLSQSHVLVYRRKGPRQPVQHAYVAMRIFDTQMLRQQEMQSHLAKPLAGQRRLCRATSEGGCKGVGTCSFSDSMHSAHFW